jgi:hypothetical protein
MSEHKRPPMAALSVRKRICRITNKAQLKEVIYNQY